MAIVEITLEQLRNAILQLPDAQRRQLMEGIERRPSTEVVGAAARVPHSILDIPPVHVGAVFRPVTSDDDLLGELLEGRA